MYSLGTESRAKLREKKILGLRGRRDFKTPKGRKFNNPSEWEEEETGWDYLGQGGDMLGVIDGAQGLEM